MVLHKSKYLHETPSISCHKELEPASITRQELLAEVARWQVILSVNYNNYVLDNDVGL